MLSGKHVCNRLLVASLVCLVPLAVSAQQATNVRISGHVAYARTSPPTSGVQLLEDIFQRVRSAPQIAMAQNLYKQQLEAAQQSPGPTDYRLAIRPKNVSGKKVPSPSLQLVPADNSFTDGLSQAFGNSGGTLVATRGAEPPPAAEAWLGNRQFPVAANEANANAKPGGFWERDVEKKEDSGVNKRQNYAPPDLATATGRLFGLTKTLQEAERMAQSVEQQQVASAPRARRVDQTAWNSSGEKDTAAYGVSMDEEESGAPMLQRAQRRESEVRAKMKAKGVPTPTPSAPAAAPISGSYGGGGAGKAQSSVGKIFNQPAEGFIVGDDKAVNKAKLAMADIALLPPNVVTGIPLVRLGISESQANSALQQIGSMKQQKVPGSSSTWTVWTWNRPQNKAATSLQLYMRNGLLDAMRIFDPSLIGNDFGVNMGDSLARVKEKFGEPAFILQEPGPGAGQNYIYPISQIGFQLARPAPGEQPRVASVLIFNVK